METGVASGCWHVFETDLGWLTALWKGDLLLQLSFGQSNPQQAAAEVSVPDGFVLRENGAMQTARKQLRKFASGQEVSLEMINLQWQGRTCFQRKVLTQCRTIPWGSVVSYGELARRCGKPTAARAVGSVMRSNRHPLIVPCHRVIAANGRIGGYSAHDGLETKRQLLAREGVVAIG